MAAVAAIVTIALAIAFAGGDESQPPTIELVTDNDFEARALGVSGSAPAGWAVETGRDHVLARSGSGLARVVVTSPGSARRVGEVLREAIAALEAIFGDAEVGPTMREARIDGRPTRTSLVALRRGDGREVQAAVSVARGADVSYLVEVFITEGAPARRLTEAEAVVESLTLSR